MKIKVKAPITVKKNKQHQTSNCNISITSAAVDLNFLLCIDLVSSLYKFQLRGGTGYGDIDFKAYSMILGAFRGNPLKIRVLRSCSENLVQLR